MKNYQQTPKQVRKNHAKDKHKVRTSAPRSIYHATNGWSREPVVIERLDKRL